MDGSFSFQSILKGVLFLNLFPGASHQEGQEKDPKQSRIPPKAHKFLSMYNNSRISQSIKTNISFLIIENPTVNSAAPSETKLFRGYSSRIKTSEKRSHLSHFLLNTQNIPFPQAKLCLLDKRIKHVSLFPCRDRTSHLQ